MTGMEHSPSSVTGTDGADAVARDAAGRVGGTEEESQRAGRRNESRGRRGATRIVRVKHHFPFGPRGSTVSGRQSFFVMTPGLTIAASPDGRLAATRHSA